MSPTSIHPDNREMADSRTINAIGLDIGGVDFLTKDITESYRETGGGICEVNAGPGFRMHVAPSEGTPRDVAGSGHRHAVSSRCTQPNSDRRGNRHQRQDDDVTDARAHSEDVRSTVGLTSTDGVYIDGQLSVAGDMTGPVSAKMILRDPSVDAAVMETARGGMLRGGLGFQTCNVACCLNVSADHLGLKGIDTLEQLAEIKRVPIELQRMRRFSTRTMCTACKMADYTDAENLCYVTMNPSHPLVKKHIPRRRAWRSCSKKA